MKPFDQFWKGFDFNGGNPKVQLTIKGLKTVIQYYIQKYSLPLTPEDYLFDFNAEPAHFSSFAYLRSEVHRKLSQLEPVHNELRLGGIYISKCQQGLTPFFCLNQNGSLSFLVCDALGLNSRYSNTRELLDLIFRAFPKANSFYIEKKRINDTHSHFSDAVYCLKSFLGKNAKGDYLIANVREFLVDHAYPYQYRVFDDIWHIGKPTHLPEPLLKVVQRKDFFNSSQQKPNDHDFDFLRKKGLHYCQIILSQYAYKMLDQNLSFNICAKVQRELILTQFKKESKKHVKDRSISTVEDLNYVSCQLEQLVNKWTNKAKSNEKKKKTRPTLGGGI